MADQEPQNPPASEPAPASTPDQEKFWSEFESRAGKLFDARLGEFYNKKKDEIFAPKTSRNGERKSGFDVIADMFFGPDKK